MNGRSSTPTGLGSDDDSPTRNYLQRILDATAHLDRAKEVLQHRKTHETEQAVFLIEEACKALIESIEIGEGIQSGESLHGEDQEEA